MMCRRFNFFLCAHLLQNCFQHVNTEQVSATCCTIRCTYLVVKQARSETSFTFSSAQMLLGRYLCRFCRITVWSSHTFPRTTSSHTQPSHKQVSHTQLSHTYLFYTICLPPSPQNSHILFQIHSINLVARNLLTPNSLTRSVFHHLLSRS